MSCLVVGSLALDTVETPHGRVEDALGGTAVFFSLASSLFTHVQLVGVVGDDFPEHGVELLRDRNVDLAGLQRRSGETFRWVGEYGDDMNVAHTLDTRLNVFGTFHPSIPEHYQGADFVFLGNIDPELQREVLRQVEKPRFVALDTMNFWINLKRNELTEAMRQVDAVLINEAEARDYTGHRNVLEAARHIQDLGPRCVVVKRGEYGSMLFTGRNVFSVPAFPTHNVQDTTGAGDSFAGAFMGYLDSRGSLGQEDLRAAAVYGTVVASHTVEGFSINGLMQANAESMSERYSRLAEITRIDLPVPARHLVTEGV